MTTGMSAMLLLSAINWHFQVKVTNILMKYYPYSSKRRLAVLQCHALMFDQYFDVDAVPIFRAGFGQGSGLILLDEVNCGGNEEGLLDCPNDGVGVSDCSPAEDAGVICMDPVECTFAKTQIGYCVHLCACVHG